MSHQGNYIRKKREDLGITQIELAKYLGFTNVFLGRVELGKCWLPKKYVNKLAQKLDVESDNIIVKMRKDASERFNESLGL